MTERTSTAASQKQEVPAYAGKMQHSDGAVTDADGKPQTGFTDAGSANNRKDPKAPYQMPLTKEEQDIMDGKKGPELAKVMKIVVAHGNAFGAPKLVKLGGAPHCSLYTGTDYMKPMIDLFQECADAGLKTYAPYTVNPRCYDVYNVNNNETDMQLIYEGYKYQRDLDWVHAQLGAPDLNYRSCVCYAPEVGNAPPPGTYVAWAESSATNYGNSALGLRTNRNAGGMELLCGLLGKAPLFGLMTDEGRKANWLIEVKTSKEPDWGVLGSAIGYKVIDGVPFITGCDQYLGTEVSNDNMHLLKKMGSATASSGAVGLYHMENLTPDAKEKGRNKLMKKGYQTYVYDDAEQARVLGNFPVEWKGRPEDPTVCFDWLSAQHLQGTPRLGNQGHGRDREARPADGGHPDQDVLLVCRAGPPGQGASAAGRQDDAGEHEIHQHVYVVSYAGMKGFSESGHSASRIPPRRGTTIPASATSRTMP